MNIYIQNFYSRKIMSSLQSTAITELLKIIPINNDTEKAIDNFVLNYLKSRPNILEEYIDNNTIYQVFLRDEDLPGVNLKFILIFSTESAAIKWIEENGSEIIASKENHSPNNSMVITIIPVSNEIPHILFQ